MPKIDPYETRAEDYDRWFERHAYVYEAELEAVRRLVPADGRGLEVGVGTGRFARPLGIAIGVDPSLAMIKLAMARGISVVAGTAENLPIRSRACDHVMMITILHLLDDVTAAIDEGYRALVPGGKIIIGFIERDSPVGREYSRPPEESTGGYFVRAHFFSSEEVEDILRKAGFTNPTFMQTIFREMDAVTDPEPVEPGHGRGSFVVVRAEKPL